MNDVSGGSSLPGGVIFFPPPWPFHSLSLSFPRARALIFLSSSSSEGKKQVQKTLKP